MNVGLIGTSVVAEKHAQAYHNIGYRLAACANRDKERGRRFADRYGATFIEDWRELCSDPNIDFIDLCTFPEFRLDVLQICARHRKPLLVEKPIAATLGAARQMVEFAEAAKIPLGVMSQHRFDASSQYLARAIEQGRLGRILQCDCYTKWYRPQEYYSRPEKGSWKTEGGGALINQAIHQIDLVRWLAGPIRSVYGQWQIAATHDMEAEDIVSAVVRYESGATGVVQAATAFWPGYSERVEIHGSKGTAILTGDRLTTWDVQNDEGETPPLRSQPHTGASEPMAISLETFEKQLLDFGEAIRTGKKPFVSGENGFHALAIVSAIYDSCRTGSAVSVPALSPSDEPG